MRMGVFGIALLILLAAADVPVFAQGVEGGRQLASALCARCHMNPGQGEKEGQMGVPSFQAIARRKGQSAEAIIAWLSSVPPMMPDHHLTQDERLLLARFILSLRD